MGQQGFNYTLRRPIGVAGLISPWNLLYLHQIAPAIAAGNTVAKPSEVTPYTAHLLSEVCQAVNLPPGVLNIVHGKGSKAGSPRLIPRFPSFPFYRKYPSRKTDCHSGSTSVQKLSLEMGGKNATIVLRTQTMKKPRQHPARAYLPTKARSVCAAPEY